jgi:hypothetical protein
MLIKIWYEGLGRIYVTLHRDLWWIVVKAIRVHQAVWKVDTTQERKKGTYT